MLIIRQGCTHEGLVSKKNPSELPVQHLSHWMFGKSKINKLNPTQSYRLGNRAPPKLVTGLVDRTGNPTTSMVGSPSMGIRR